MFSTSYLGEVYHKHSAYCPLSPRVGFFTSKSIKKTLNYIISAIARIIYTTSCLMAKLLLWRAEPGD